MGKVQFNLHKPLNRLESSLNKRFSPGDISIAVHHQVSRQTVHALLNKRVKSVTLDTLAALIDFFATQGMTVSFDDLFEYTPTEPSATRAED